MHNLFIALTPLHVITATCSDKREPEDLVVLIDQNGCLFYFYEIIRHSDLIKNLKYVDASALLDKIPSYFFNNKNPISTRFEKNIRHLTDRKYEHVYVFNDLAPEVQLILSRINFSTVHYIEDGSAAYNSHYVARNIYKEIIIKVLFGGFYDPINVIGTSKYIFDGLYSYPESVRAENKSKPVKKLSFKKDYRSNLRLLAHRYRNIYGKSDDTRKKCIIFVPQSQESDISKLVSNAQSNAGMLGFSDLQFILKFHPFSDVEIESEVLSDERLILCPREMPGELLPEIYKNVVLVLGEGSTILMNIRRFYDNIKVLNLAKSSPSSYDKFLTKIGVIN